MKIYVVRHGETDANKESRFQGWEDWPLNGSGRDLAVLTGRGMKGIRFDHAVTSPLLRASQTARIVLDESGNGGVTLAEDDRLKELYCGVCENLLLNDAGEYTELLRLFFRNPLPHVPQGFPRGETMQQLMDRTQSLLFEIAEGPWETVLLSTHGCALRAMLNFLYDDPQDFWHGHVPYNCAVNILEAKNGKITLLEDDRIYYDPALCVDRFRM